MKSNITGLHSELGSIFAPSVVEGATQNIHFNLVGQQANSLLHDGHAWKDFPQRALAGARRAVREAQAGEASMLVHASFAFVHAFERQVRPKEPLRESVQAILACEELVLRGPLPACVERRPARLSTRFSSWEALLVRAAAGAAVPPAPGRRRNSPVACSYSQQRWKDLLRH